MAVRRGSTRRAGGLGARRSTGSRCSGKRASRRVKARTPTERVLLLVNTGEKPVQSNNGLVTTVGYKIGAQPAVYALEGSIAVTGALVQWCATIWG